MSGQWGRTCEIWVWIVHQRRDLAAAAVLNLAPIPRIFVKDEDGRWMYGGGDEDFEPRNEEVARTPDAPQDQGKGGFASKAKTKAKGRKASAGRRR